MAEGRYSSAVEILNQIIKHQPNSAIAGIQMDSYFVSLLEESGSL
jgi:hypothetical protein